MDGASNAHGNGAGLILTSPNGIDVEYALRFGLRDSNKEAEYEAVVAGLNLAHFMEADQLEVCNDSQLVVKQIEDDYESKSEKRKDDSLSQEAARVAQKIRTGLG